jgi:NifB/MoaA-like Fe-S oxidoreductase
VRLVTAASMAPFLRERAPRLARATGATVEVVEVTNDYFGETVTVAGLLGGRDILRALDHGRAGDVILLPAEALNADDRFIDDFPRAELVDRLGLADVRTGYEVTEALVSL